MNPPVFEPGRVHQPDLPSRIHLQLSNLNKISPTRVFIADSVLAGGMK